MMIKLTKPKMCGVLAEILAGMRCLEYKDKPGEAYTEQAKIDTIFMDYIVNKENDEAATLMDNDDTLRTAVDITTKIYDVITNDQY